MSTHSRKYTLVSFVFALLLAPTLLGQTPSPNADILKMIQAGLPESVIIDKISAGTGHWDVSVDALIALKQAGATPAEMKAMTSPLASAPMPTAAPQPIYIAGGLLRRTAAGDPYIQFAEKNPTLFPDGTHSNQAFLISYEGKPAIQIPAQHVAPGNFRAGNLIITPTNLLFNPYLLEWKYGWYPKNARYEMKGNAAKEAMESAFSMPSKDVLITYKKFQREAAFEDRTMSFSKKGNDFNVGFHYTGYPSTWTVGTVLCEPTENCNSTQLEQFVHDLTRDFAGTITPILTAAGISDVDRQLSPAAHYHLITSEEFPKYAAIYQAQLDSTPAPTQHSGGGLAAFAEITQIAAAGAGAVAQSQAGGNTVAAQNNAMTQYYQNVATIESGGTPNLTPTPAATPQDALNHQLATIKAAAPPAAAASGSSTPKNFTYSENLPNGDIRKSTTTGVQGAYTITIQCFTHNGSAPYFTYSRNGPSDFFFNLPPCSGSPTVASAAAPPPPSNTVAPPVPYQKPPSTGGTVVASGAVCPASGYTFTSYGDAATGVPCTPGQPIASSSGAGAGSGASGGSSSGSSAGSGLKTTPALTNCLAQSYVDGDLTVTNTCNVPVYATWWINGHGGSWTLNPGEHTGTGYSSSDVAVGGASYYVCPKNASPTDSSGNALTGPVSSYVCVVRY